ncbi:MAG: DNA-3-methyladenine glycosylase 2 family protein [Clostridiales bacterium]|nr:DNA-3-methyladenine glycosylase 2 family protein [Clostridiales bacterium]
MAVERIIRCFDPERISRSGQCFRMHAGDENVIVAIAGRDRVTVEQVAPSLFVLDCSEKEFEDRWMAYFDIARDYAQIQEEAMRADAVLCHATKACSGLRILKQDPWEMLISFLISQRKSIKAIQTCIEQLCEKYGEKIEGDDPYHAFPTPVQLLSAGEVGLRSCGVGYRAPYLMDAAKRVASGELALEEITQCSNDELMEELLAVHGVGVKVASCVMLFGYHRLDSSPIDVWIQRVIDESYGGVSPFEGYGKHAGIYQQYLFLERRDRGM